MFTFATKPQNLASIFISSIQLYKSCFRQIWRWQLLWLIPTLFLPTSTSLNTTGVLNVLSTHLHNSFSFFMILYTILVVLITIYGETFLLSKIYNSATQQEVPTNTTLVLAKNKFLPILGGYAITWGVLLALFIAVGLVFGLIFWIISLFSNETSSSLHFAIPSILVILTVGGVFLVVLMFFFNLFILFENNKTIAAIKSSIKLVWRNWLRTFAVLLVPAIIIFIAVQIMNFLVGLIAPGLTLTTNVANVIVLTVLYPWFNSLILVQFNDLKLRQGTATTAKSNIQI